MLEKRDVAEYARRIAESSGEQFDAEDCDEWLSRFDVPLQLAHGREYISRITQQATVRQFMVTEVEAPAFLIRKSLMRFEEAVSDLRKDLFGAPRAPFASVEEVDEWLSAELDQLDTFDPEEYGRLKRRTKELLAEIQDLQDRVNKVGLLKVATYRFSATIKHPATGQPYHPPLCTRIGRLRYEADALAGACGISSREALLYILSGAYPRPVAMVATSHAIWGHPAVDLRIRSPVLTFEELSRVYRKIKEELWPKEPLAGARYSGDDFLLDEVVHELGGPPEQFWETDFWKRVSDELQSRGGYGGHLTWKALATKWQRLEVRLERLGAPIETDSD